MIRSALQAEAFPLTAEMRRRHIFTLVSLVFTVILLGWGAVVTSIEAGLAVPDWPTSFDSMDPLNPLPGWWSIPPVLAEHGHRLMGMLVGACILILAVWTWLKDPRSWMKKTATVALLLVIFQGTLGGLRVVWLSIDLAVVHACVAQLFFAMLVSMALFTSKAWLQPEDVPEEGQAVKSLRKTAIFTVGVIYIQIIFGALLRHPGAGIDMTLVAMHIIGATFVFGMVFMSIKAARRADPRKTLISKLAHGLAGILTVQIGLGVFALIVTVMESGAPRSTMQIWLNTSHMLVGALFFSTAVVFFLVSARRVKTSDLKPH